MGGWGRGEVGSEERGGGGQSGVREGGNALEFTLGQLPVLCLFGVDGNAVRVQLFSLLLLVTSSSLNYFVATADGVLFQFRQPSSIPAEKLIACCRCCLSHF